ncbi:MAG: fructose bisphosphate aldolase [Candidatus Planktophila sp.]|nr:fructose bisphosphate aldolase [Candidatus Planktophila sp.]
MNQLQVMRLGHGFIAALDQSGGSTPKALKLYGIEESSYSNEAEMFDLVHAMRSRIIKSPVFTSDRILGVILFEMTMNREIDGMGAAEFLWNRKGIVPFLKIDSGLLEVVNGVQLMKPIPQLSQRLKHAKSHQVFGTKMRSVIKLAHRQGIESCLKQQFEIAAEVLDEYLIPIIEPEVDIWSPEKAEAETILKDSLISELDSLTGEQSVMLKLTLPSINGFYSDLVSHPRVLRVVALSGGYSRLKANELLAHNHGLVASFSRALTEGLNIHQSESEFDSVLDESIQSIFDASTIKVNA